MAVLRCTACSETRKQYPPKYKCEKCEGLLEYSYDFEQLEKGKLLGSPSFWKYRPFLPQVRSVVSLGEGGTPLHPAKRLAERLGLHKVYLKDETRNPTNSFRDRCAALLTSNAVDLNYESVVCASNGNLGASMAAYCAKSGLVCQVVVPKIVDMGKLAQMLIYDAIIKEHGETVDESTERAESLATETDWYQASAELNPLVIEAQKTISYEVAEQIRAVDWVVVSMGSGGTIYSIWKGFKELRKLGMVDKLPRLIGVQAEECAPIVHAHLEGKSQPVITAKSSTHALAILVKRPMYGKLALRALKESKGLTISVSDQEIFTAEQEIAKLEGLFAEPASSATIAALKGIVDEGPISREDEVVCLITGSGLKATDVLQALTKRRKTAMIGLELSTKEKILHILDQKDTYGYALWKKLGKTITRSAIYQHLDELSDKGLVVSYEKEGRKYFKITNRGKRVLRAIDELKVLL
ncbi:threonine synthase [Candidatus Bathyarchaeota archaeon]|nr:threonine synthase [Candidatus Bathyarchaeota archaeon]NIU81436.1 threonine synthase [Candidatus Bathyarchaeota archaeon]